MVVCRFFQEGRCKFGENCRNEHYIPQDPRRSQRTQYDDRNVGYQQQQQYSNQQLQRQQYIQQPRLFTQQNQSFGNQSVQFGVSNGQQGGRGAQDGETLIRNNLNVVREDAVSWDKSGQWPFSCYAPLLHRLLNIGTTKDGGSLPGLKDYSPEEIRWEMYERTDPGAVTQFLAKLQQTAEDYQAKRYALQNMDQATANFIVRYEAGGMANPIGTVFATTPTLLEPKQAAPQSNTMNSCFSFAIQGPGTAPAAVVPPAAAPASTGPKSFQFALPGSNAPAVPNAAPSFSFSLPGTQNPASSFQTNPAQTNPPAYGFGAVQTQKPVFGAAPPPAYGTQPQTSVFGANQAQGAMFGASPAQPSAFGVSPIQQSFTPQIAAKADSNVFSNMGDLKKEEVEQFNSQKFCMGKIPMNPPPRELCM